MRLVMMGTGPFAVPTFESLLRSDHQVVALMTRPTPPTHIRQKAPANPMRDAAEQKSVPVLALEDVNSQPGRRALSELEPALLVVCDFGQILSRETLAIAPLGGINLHASLLPKYRGAAPINWAIYHGETHTGVTVIHMSSKLDAGPCLVQRQTAIGPDETAVELEKRLSQIGVEPVLQAINELAAWDGHSNLGIPQDAAAATKAPRLKKSDGQVDWSRTAVQIKDQVRAFKPWPGTYTHWQRSDGQTQRLILDQVSVHNTSSREGPPATVVNVDRQQLLVATGSGILALDRVQPSGKTPMDIAAFLRGHAVAPGNRFV